VNESDPTKTVLVTGGAGSVGREVVLLLAERGHRVRVFDLPGCDFSPLGSTEADIFEGDITDGDAVRQAAEGVDVALHLAALLPPNSERSKKATMAVNVQGTANLIAALEAGNPDARLVLSSSVCVYGDTSARQPPIGVDAPLQAVDIYAESKIEAERLAMASSLRCTVLRISGISVPAFLAPPAVWPFQAEQRIEFICRDDVVRALAACVATSGEAAAGAAAPRTTLNIAGGPTWRMLGRAYVARFNEVMGLPPGEGQYSDRPGYFDWYDTAESQAALGYQQTTFEQFLERLDKAIEAAIGE
jgi:nucleoside-diphosphate-sugar epimerase